MLRCDLQLIFLFVSVHYKNISIEKKLHVQTCYAFNTDWNRAGYYLMYDVLATDDISGVMYLENLQLYKTRNQIDNKFGFVESFFRPPWVFNCSAISDFTENENRVFKSTSSMIMLCLIRFLTPIYRFRNLYNIMNQNKKSLGIWQFSLKNIFFSFEVSFSFCLISFFGYILIHIRKLGLSLFL